MESYTLQEKREIKSQPLQSLKQAHDKMKTKTRLNLQIKYIYINKMV